MLTQQLAHAPSSPFPDWVIPLNFLCNMLHMFVCVCGLCGCHSWTLTMVEIYINHLVSEWKNKQKNNASIKNIHSGYLTSFREERVREQDARHLQHKPRPILQYLGGSCVTLFPLELRNLGFFHFMHLGSVPIVMDQHRFLLWRG